MSGLEIVTVTSGSSSTNKSATAQCGTGKFVVGGGFAMSLTNGDIGVTSSGPGATSGKSNTWVAAGTESGNGTNSQWTVTAYAICATA